MAGDGLQIERMVFGLMTTDFPGLSPFFVKRLQDRNILHPTDIQLKVIPQIAAGENVFFTSATGTGKTFAYLLPLLEKLLGANDAKTDPEPAQDSGGAIHGSSWPRFLVLSPTLELCSQIKAEVDFLLGDVDAKPELKVSLVLGSANMSRQIDSLKKTRPDIIVGNPGRLLVLAKMNKIKFNGLRFIVLDEADRLVSDEMLGEIKQLCEMIARATGKSEGALQLAACSATLNEKSRQRLSSLGFSPNTAFVESAGNEILRDHIEHWAIFSEGRKKNSALRSLLAAAKPKKALVFLSKADDAGTIAGALQYHHINAAALFGSMDKRKRKEAVDGFRSGKIAVLVSSDLAARGLDIPGITHIIALDVPEDKEIYIHRAGRSGRAGRRGIMVSIGDEGEMRRLAALEKKLGIVVYPKELYGGRVVTPNEE